MLNRTQQRSYVAETRAVGECGGRQDGGNRIMERREKVGLQ